MWKLLWLLFNPPLLPRRRVESKVSNWVDNRQAQRHAEAEAISLLFHLLHQGLSQTLSPPGGCRRPVV